VTTLNWKNGPRRSTTSVYLSRHLRRRDRRSRSRVCFTFCRRLAARSWAPILVDDMVLRACPSGLIEPCLPSPADRLPSGPDWVHEIKHDGYRLMARRGPVGGSNACAHREGRRPAHGEDLRREPLKPQGSYVRARAGRPRLQIERFRRCSLPALQQ
jgi:hypothetical protein